MAARERSPSSPSAATPAYASRDLPFALPMPSGGQNPSASALAVTPTVYPVSCLLLVPPYPSYDRESLRDGFGQLPAAELLRDFIDGQPDPSSILSRQLGVPTGTAPDGVTVDPCNRFVYVANGGPGNSGNRSALTRSAEPFRCQAARKRTSACCRSTLRPLLFPPATVPGRWRWMRTVISCTWWTRGPE